MTFEEVEVTFKQARERQRMHDRATPVSGLDAFQVFGVDRHDGDRSVRSPPPPANRPTK